MKQLSLFIVLALSINVVINTSCGKSKEVVKENPEIDDEVSLLLDFIQKSGDLINSEKAPFTLGADEVFEGLSSFLIIDIRDTLNYFNGHIDGAVWVDPKELPEFLEEKVNASVYEKIVIASYSGQSSAYYASLLRMIGYSNVFTLRYGMSGWSNKIKPNRILDNLSNRYAGILDTKANPLDKKYAFPEIKTGKKNGYSILLSRVKTLVEEGFTPAHIKIDSIVNHIDKFFVINYWPETDYNKGHLPGSFLFQPKESLSQDKLLAFLPTNKPIAVYCSNGQVSASAVAYLRVLGYDARSISFGSNGFMYGYMQANGIKAFNPTEYIADYPLLEGKNPSLQTNPVISTNEPTREEKTPSVIPVKKKQKTSGGGC